VCISLYNPDNEEFLTKAEDLAGIAIDRIEVPSEDDVIQAKEKAKPS